MRNAVLERWFIVEYEGDFKRFYKVLKMRDLIFVFVVICDLVQMSANVSKAIHSYVKLLTLHHKYKSIE